MIVEIMGYTCNARVFVIVYVVSMFVFVSCLNDSMFTLNCCS